LNITYAVEHLRDMKLELESLLPLHYEEIARDKDIIALDPDWDSYFMLEAAGQFHCMVARCEGKMIGYHISFIRPNLHYRKSLTAATDIYFIRKEFRLGLVGFKLFREVEKSWRARGVQKAFSGTKRALNMGKLFQRLGWTHIEDTYAKVLK
jgi:GNAT superfamily N-acetyltransferase